MIRILLFFGLVFLLALGWAWVADIEGLISVSFNGYVWQQTPVVAALLVGVFLMLFLAVVWAIRVVLKSPQIAGRFFKRRRKDKGYAALSQGLIALGTGNAKLARRHGLDADRLLSEEPAAKLLLAQTAQLAGKDDEARQRFEAMLEDPDTKALGLHGLFVEAERHNEPVAARHYAEEAVKTAPGLEWAGKAVLGYQAVSHHWEEALKSLERNYAAKMLDKKSYRRQRAVILTALALKLEEGEPERAFAFAKEAHSLALDLVPAALVTSRLATRRGDVRKAAKVIEATWRLFPHPELAETYAHVRTGDSAVDRLKRVKSLSAQRANTPEGAIAVARAALEAREFDEARTHLKKVLQSTPTRSAFVLMAEIEEAEHGDRGRMRDWLARAVKAPLDKAWISDGIVSAEWQAVSPVTGKLDVFEWATPVGLVSGEGEVLEDSLFDAPVLPAATTAATAAPVEDAGPSVDVPEEPKTLDIEPLEVKSEQSKTEEPSEKAGAAKPAMASKSGYEGTTDDVRHTPPLNNLPDTPEPGDDNGVEKAKAAEPAGEVTKKDGQDINGKQSGEDAGSGADEKKSVAEDKSPEDTKKSEADDTKQPIEFPLSRMPDDPGTEDDDKKALAKAPRPRFFN